MSATDRRRPPARPLRSVPASPSPPPSGRASPERSSGSDQALGILRLRGQPASSLFRTFLAPFPELTLHGLRHLGRGSRGKGRRQSRGRICHRQMHRLVQQSRVFHRPRREKGHGLPEHGFRHAEWIAAVQQTSREAQFLPAAVRLHQNAQLCVIPNVDTPGTGRDHKGRTIPFFLIRNGSNRSEQTFPVAIPKITEPARDGISTHRIVPGGLPSGSCGENPGIT